MESETGSQDAGLRACIVTLLFVATATATTLQGTVLDGYTRQPVPYAEIEVVGQPVHAWTDSLGRFDVAVDSSAARLTINASRVGYQTRLWDNVAATKPLVLYLLQERIELRGVTVSANRTPSPIERSGSVTVIEQPDLVARGRTSLAEVVATLPSTTVQDYGNMVTMAMRGATSEQTLVLLDGVKVNSAQDNLVDVSTLPLVLASRVEVARGGASALYGANAVGGVVNVLTPEPDRLSMRTTGGIGSFGQRYLQAVHTNWSDPVGYLVGFDLARSKGNFTWRDSLDSIHVRTNSAAANTGAFAKGLFREGRHRASLLGEYHVSERGSPGPVTFPSDSARMADARGIAHLDYSFQETDDARLEATLFHHRFWRNYRNPDPYFTANDTHSTTATGLNLNQRFYPARWAALQVGIEANREGFASTAIGNPARWTRAAWAQTELEWHRVILTPAARVDWLSESKPLPDSSTFRANSRALNPRVSVAWSYRRWLSLFAGVNRSFRAPTFNELYWPEDQWTRGNPRLKPEQSTGVELHASGRPTGFLSYHLAGFATRSTDLIQWQPDSAGAYQPVNIATADVSGAEVETEIVLRHIRIRANATYTLPRSQGFDLVYRPRLAFSVAHWARLDWVCLGWIVRHTGRRFTTVDNSRSLPGSTTFDVETVLSPQVGRARPALRTGVRNLFDRRHETVEGYPAAGRNWYLELELGN